MMELMTYGFMQRALLAVVAMSCFAPLLGVFLVLRRQSLLSDTLSHVSLAGVAFGLMIGVNPNLTTVLIVSLAAIFLEYLRRLYKHFLEVSTAILMNFGLAIALIIVNLSSGKQSLSIDQYLFGSILTISDQQVYLLFAIAVLSLLLLGAFLRPLYLMTFDEDTALVEGVPVGILSAGFNIVTGLAIALMIPVAGALLVSAIMILPALIAMQLGQHFKTVLLFASVFAFVGMIGGVFASYYYEVPASSAITVLFVSLLLLVTIAKTIKVK